MKTLQLTPADIQVPFIRSKARDGVPVVLSLSAYDIPVSLRVDESRDGGDKISITFTYLDAEPPRAIAVDDHLTVMVGASSGKVLGFRVAAADNPHDIIVRIVAGVEQQLRHTTRDIQKLNYKMIQGVVFSKLEPLLTAT
jgi:hypothetical protein